MLENRKEGAGAGCRDFGEQTDEPVAAVFNLNDALVLNKSPAPINPVPSQERVERIEIRVEIDKASAFTLVPIVEFIEDAYRHSIEEKARKVERHGHWSPRRLLEWRMALRRPEFIQN